MSFPDPNNPFGVQPSPRYTASAATSVTSSPRYTGVGQYDPSAIPDSYRYMTPGGGASSATGRYAGSVFGGQSGGNRYSSMGISPTEGAVAAFDQGNTALTVMGNQQALADRQADAAAAAGGGTAATAGSATGGRDWSHLNALDQSFTDASSKTGAPANFIKAVVANESSMGTSGLEPKCFEGDKSVNRPDYCVVPFSGIKDGTAASWGFDWARLQTDKDYNIWAVGTILAGIANWDDPYNPGMTIFESYGWDGVAATYFLGDPVATGLEDEMGNIDTEYIQNVNILWDELDAGAATGQTWDAPAPITAPLPNESGIPVLGIDTMMSSADGPWVITQGWGKEDNFWNSPDGIAVGYGYGSNYGMNGGHEGLDIGVADNSALRTPVGGTIIIVGNQYYDPTTGAVTTDTPHFGDWNGGVGEIRLRLDNGDEVIFGHMSELNPEFKVGDRVEAGDLIGTTGSGGIQNENPELQSGGAHLHLEVRQYNPGAGTPTGYVIVDPRVYLATGG